MLPVNSSTLQTVRLRFLLKTYRGFSTGPVLSTDRKLNYLPIADFYAGKSVLVTGGTGFVGKVFIEKLLYSCKKIEKVYVLVRALDIKGANERIQELKHKPLFTRLKKERPQDLDKIIPIIGDISVPNLGIKPEDEVRLLEDVSVVFHSAATIKFNEPLKVALNINLEGTRRLLGLCQRMENMEAFVHISTAYTNTDKRVIEEIVYPPPAKLEEVYKFIEKYGDDEEKTRQFLNGRPNTYTFTKALTECLIAETHQSVPSVIVRPSMVKSGRNEPLRGWLDAWSIPTAILFSVGKGLNRVVVGEKNTIVDFIPVDYVVNLSIVAATRCNRLNEVAVYNSCTSVCNPITLSESLQLFCDESRKQGFNELPFPWALNTRSQWLIMIVTFVMQTLPANLVDFCLKVSGKKPRLVKLNKKFTNIRNLAQYFTGTTWFMTSRHAQTLATSLSPHDQKEFPCNPADIDWQEFMKTHFHGVKTYLVGEKSGVKDL